MNAMLDPTMVAARIQCCALALRELPVCDRITASSQGGLIQEVDAAMRYGDSEALAHGSIAE